MTYIDEVMECNDLQELFDVWRNKTPETINLDGNTISINHKNNIFIPDGIVNADEWNKREKKRILFVLKEAYGDDWGESTLATWLRDSAPTVRIWSRVARWVYGIENTTTFSLQRYVPQLEREIHKKCLNQIAVMNLKKSGGESSSKYDEIKAYAQADREEIKKEFSLIDADIVICGSTFKTLLSEVYKKDYNSCDNWYYYMNLDGKERLFIDMYHPANHWSDLMNYYTVVSIYQQALIEKEKTKT